MRVFLNSAIASIWLFSAGVLSSVRADRILVYYIRDYKIFTLTFSCMLLNGAVFLGSLTLLNWTIKPLVASFLSTLSPTTSTAALRIFDGLSATFWVLPAYTISYFVSCIWYGEIAERTAFAAQKEAQQRLVDASKMIAPKPSRLLQVRNTDTITALSRQVYSAFFFVIHFCVAMILGKFPFIGPVIQPFMFSSLYGLYCFDYKYNLHGVPLEHRTQAVEEHWAYFTGFGALMVFVAAKLPFFIGSAVGLLLYPLFIVAAADANPREAYLKVRQWYQKHGSDVTFARLPLFTVSLQVTNFFLGVVQRRLGRSSNKTVAKTSRRK